MANPIDIQKADPLARRKVLRWLLPLAVVGLALAAGLTGLANIIDPRHLGGLVIGAVVLLGLIGVAMLWPLGRLWRIGRDATLQARFPPAGIAVMRDTRIHRGPSARRHGAQLRRLAELLIVFVLLVPAVIFWLFLRFALSLSG
jgi:hypothetical protein